MKTPEDIKKGLECCDKLCRCNVCPYRGEEWCATNKNEDALAYIQQLEEKLKAYEWYEGESADENT